MTKKTTDGCEHCNKSSLSLLLLRPSPVAKVGPLVPPGAAAVQSDDGLVEGLIPARRPTESRTVLRLLRAGFVHVYIPDPPAPLKQWLVYQVTENGDLIAQSNPTFNPSTPPQACARKGHNALGMRILTLPQAHKLDQIWIAFSSNLWNDKLRAQNAANPKAMQQVQLQGVTKHSFKPEAPALRSKVLECALSALKINGSSEHDFSFVSLAQSVDGLARTLTEVAACHPKTKGKELALVLPDPVGYTTELNALRLRRHEMAKQEMEKPEVAHPFNSSNALLGLKRVMLSANELRGYDAISPVMSEGAFKDIMRVKPNPRGWPQETQWKALEDTRENRAQYGHRAGRVTFPDQQERSQAWARKQTEATWKGMERHYDEEARSTFIKTLDARMRTEHWEPLKKFEVDWWEARQDKGFNQYFEFHYDETDPNDPKQLFSPGTTYQCDAAISQTPPPLTQGAHLEQYQAELQKKCGDKTAVLLRSLVANQAELLPQLSALYAIEPGQALGHLHDKRNDKLYSLAAGMLAGAHGASNPNAAQRLVVKYGWLSTGIGAVSGGYALLIAQSLLGAVVTAGVLAAEFGSAKSEHVRKLLWYAETSLLAHRVGELARQSAVSGGGLRTPMQIFKHLPLGRAKFLLAGQVSPANLRRASRDGHVLVALLTDNHEAARYAGNVDGMLAQGAGRVTLPRTPSPALLNRPLTSGTLQISDSEFEHLWRARVGSAARAAQAAQEGFNGAKAVIHSLDGRLALGVILINGVGALGALQDLDSEDAKTFRNAWVGMADSSLSVLAGLLQVWEVGAKASIAHRLGANAVAQSAGIHTLRAFAAGFGSVAGLVNAYGQWAKGEDARADNDLVMYWLYQGSASAFALTSVTGGLAAAGAIADRAIARGATGSVVRWLAVRFGAQGAATLLGISVSGWGLIFLGAALLFEVGTVVMNPTVVQEWMRRSYFGKGEKKFARGDWAAEFAALEKALGLAERAPEADSGLAPTYSSGPVVA